MPERAAQLYAAGVALFIERGYHDVDVDDIAARCDVSHGTFYGYFRSKRDLLEAILTRTLEELVAIVSNGHDWPAISDRDAFIAEFSSLIDQALQYISDNAALLSFVLLTAPGIDADAYASLLSGYERLGAEVSGALQIAAQHGWMRTDVDLNVQWAGQMTVSCVAAAALPLLLATGEAFDVAEVSRGCSNYLLGGMRATLSSS